MTAWDREFGNEYTSEQTYAPAVIADKRYEVTAARFADGREAVIGERLPMAGRLVGQVDGERIGEKVVRIVFYTGFAGCPARYFITLESNRTFVAKAEA